MQVHLKHLVFVLSVAPSPGELGLGRLIPMLKETVCAETSLFVLALEKPAAFASRLLPTRATRVGAKRL